jgi:hypothetical protein
MALQTTALKSPENMSRQVNPAYVTTRKCNP